MGSLNLNSLRNIEKKDNGYTYVDLHLDIEEASVPTMYSSEHLKGKDIRVDYDERAVMNSINNIFQTSPGERFLVPTFGINLRRYLFDPVSKDIANEIGNEIVNAIERWEPRVTVDQVRVLGLPETNEYEVTLILTINAIRKQVTFNGVLNQDVGIDIRNLERVCPV